MASMIATELIKIIFSACPTGPCGSRMAGRHAVRASGAASPAQRAANARIESLPAPARLGEDGAHG